MASSAQDLIRRLRAGEMPAEEILRLLRAGSILVRANAFEAIVPHARRDETLIHEIREAAIHPDNQVRLMGTISVAHVAVAALFRVGDEKADEAARRLIDAWPEPDRGDLLWWLRSEGLLGG